MTHYDVIGIGLIMTHYSAPFLAELLEDDDQNVEKKIHETIKFLEEQFKGEISNFF